MQIIVILNRGLFWAPRSLGPCSDPSIPVYTCMCVCMNDVCTTQPASCLFLFGRDLRIPARRHKQIQIRSITHLVSRPLLPLRGTKYHSLLLQHCQTQFQSFSSAKSSCIFRLSFMITLRSGNRARRKSV